MARAVAIDVQRDPEQERDDEAGERRVTHGVADEGQAAQHDEGTHHRAHDPDQDRGHQATLHEPEAHRVEEELQHAHRRPSWKWRSPAGASSW